MTIEETPLCSPEDYFDGDRFKAQRFAKDLVEYFTLITVEETDEIYGWNGGCYEGGASGENIVKAKLPGLLRDMVLKLSQHHINEVIAHVRVQSYRPYGIFDSNLDQLPLKNGVLDIKTSELEPYGNLKHFFLFKLPVDYDPTADCQAFKDFVSEVVYPADVPVVQEIFGYCLWRDGMASIKKAIMLLGTGDNGKSLLLSVLISLLGERSVSATSLSNLAENRFASARLRGKLANVHPDLPDKALRDTGQFKGLIGDDIMPFEIKHGGGGEFRNRAKLIFSANKLPDAQDDSDGYYTRWVILNFPYAFVRGKKDLVGIERLQKDKNQLKSKLTAPKELSGILNWSLEGLRRLQVNGCFTNEISSDKMRDLYVKLANSLKAFVIDKIAATGKPDDYLSKDDFYRDYIIYCQDRKLAAFTKTRVGRDLPDCCPGQITSGRDYVRGDRPPTWRGVRLRKDEKASEDSQQILTEGDGL
jgi:putative DNA primase/helicase